MPGLLRIQAIEAVACVTSCSTGHFIAALPGATFGVQARMDRAEGPRHNGSGRLLLLRKQIRSFARWQAAGLSGPRRLPPRQTRHKFTSRKRIAGPTGLGLIRAARCCGYQAFDFCHTIGVMTSTAAIPCGQEEQQSPGGRVAVLAIATVGFLAQILTANRYGYFRDELYYVDCARHLGWGYVDHPPLIALLTSLELHIGGSSLYSLRFLPAIAAGLTVWLAGKMSRALGATVFGQALAALCVLLAPGYLALFHLSTMNAFEPLFWTSCAYIVLRLVQTGNQKLWLWFGVLSGIGILNKWSMLLVGGGVFVGLVLTAARAALKQKWAWLGLAIAMLIWLPNVIWNVQHHWPFLELMHNVRHSGRDVTHGLIGFLVDQSVFMGIFSAPIWMAGAWWLFFGRDRLTGTFGRYRILGWVWLFLLVFFIVAGGKSYYLWPIYPTLYAAGSVIAEEWSAAHANWLRPVYVGLMVVAAAVLLPIFLPVLSPAALTAYQQKLHLSMPQVEHQRNGPLNQQLYADMFGWDEMARETARAYYALPPQIRAKTAITGRGFGEAGAIDFFGPRYGLPAAISGHQTYWFWGPRGYTGESLLMLGERERRVHELCHNVDVVGHVSHPLSREDEHFDIYWCHPLRWDLHEIWPQAHHFD